MTDSLTTPGPRLKLVLAGSIRDALTHLIAEAPVQPPLFLPSSGRRRDDLVAATRARLRELAVPSAALPYGHGPGLPPMGSPEGGRPRQVRVNLPDGTPYTVRLPQRLADAASVWVAVDVDAVPRGPYALDLLFRYLPLRDRMRALAARGRHRSSELLLARPIDTLVLARRLADGVIAAITADPIVAELLALSLAEDLLPAGSTTSGVWEDPEVQRATELELGARFPGEIEVDLLQVVESQVGTRSVDRVLSGMGVRTP